MQIDVYAVYQELRHHQPRVYAPVCFIGGAIRIEIDKNRSVASAKALSGPPELFQSSVEAAKQYQFEPPQNGPVTTELEMTYGLEPKPCPPGTKGKHLEVSYTENLPMKTEHAGQLRIVSDLNEPLPPYPEEARAGAVHHSCR